MQRKPGFPVANCSIKMPECPVLPEGMPISNEDDVEQRRLQLINFGHSQWGFNNWSWSVTKQDVDFVDFANGKYCAGVAAFVNITVKSFDIHRENVGYATSVANTKGFAVYKSRKCAVTNALRETLLSFGGSVATELIELLEAHRIEGGAPANQCEVAAENNQNVANRAAEPKNSPLNRPPRKDSAEVAPPAALRSPHAPQPPPAVKNAPAAQPPPMGPPLPAPPGPPCPSVPPANRQHLAGRPIAARPNSNEGAKTSAEQSEEDARAERKRRQRLAQEEFRQKQQQLTRHNPDEKHELSRNSSSFERLLLDIPTQDIEIEDTPAGAAAGGAAGGKREAPDDAGAAKRRAASLSRLDIVKD